MIKILTLTLTIIIELVQKTWQWILTLLSSRWMLLTTNGLHIVLHNWRWLLLLICLSLMHSTTAVMTKSIINPLLRLILTILSISSPITISIARIPQSLLIGFIIIIIVLVVTLIFLISSSSAKHTTIKATIVTSIDCMAVFVASILNAVVISSSSWKIVDRVLRGINAKNALNYSDGHFTLKWSSIDIINCKVIYLFFWMNSILK